MTSDAASMGALQGYRIIDMTSMISGPLGTVLDRSREPDTQSTFVS
jgi:crotonobetainyl-CoA:carnitine CoA-transferase CaiB-like acyl-CoA transferase